MNATLEAMARALFQSWFVDCVGGGTPSTAEPKYWEGGTHHWTTPKDFSSLQAPVLLDTDRKLTDAGIAKISSGLLPVGTLLLSSRAPVGYLAIAAMPVAINQGFIALKCNERASNFFMLNWYERGGRRWCAKRAAIGLAGCTGASRATGGPAWSGTRRAAARAFPCSFTPERIIRAPGDAEPDASRADRPERPG